MRFLRLIICISSLAWMATGLHSGSRAASWIPERSVGSDRVDVLALKYVVLPEGAAPPLRAAVEDMRAVFLDRTGINLEYAEAQHFQGKQSIVFELKSSYDSEGGFHIHSKRTSILVRAGSEAGLLNAVYAICQDVLAVRWYWSGEYGMEYVDEVVRRFPSQPWRESPAFIHRAMSRVDRDFSRRNRLIRAFQFNHALAKVFNADMYKREPEVFSVVRGRRRQPKGHGGMDPQPNMGNPRAVELAAEAAIKHFKMHPQSRSFSLSINDNVLFDETELTQQLVSPVKYFRTRPNYTNYVFGFMNAVAEKVFDEAGAWQNANGEDRYLTGLAYFWTEPSPTISLHPRVMPVLTSDRSQWHDPSYRLEDQALIKAWAHSGAERIATWDYYFGAPYPYPRQSNQWVEESIRYLYEQGVDVFYAEVGSADGMNGAKSWLAAELLWNPRQNAAELLDEFYDHFFGAAGATIRAFYETAEQHRNTHEGKADWIKFYKDEAGIGLFPESVLQQMRGYLDAAILAVTGDPRRAARVQIVSESFEFTESYARFHAARQKLIEGILLQSLSLQELLLDYQNKRASYNLTAERISSKPMQQGLKVIVRQLQSDPAPLAIMGLAGQGLLSAEQDRYGLNELITDPDCYRSSFQDTELTHDGQYRLNFIGPELPRISNWHFDFRPAQHLKVQGVNLEERGVCVSGADVFSMFRDVRIAPERTYILDTLLSWQISPDNRTQIKCVWSDMNGKHLRTDLPLQLPWGKSEGVQRLQIPFRSPKHAYYLRIHFTTSRQYEGDYLELRSVDFGALHSVPK